MLKKLCVLGIASFGLAVGVGFGACGEPTIPVPILVYHRFGPVASNEMTITTPVFESQLKRLRSGGYTVIPLRHLIAYLRCQGPRPPAKAVVITADDGHASIYEEMGPLIQAYGFPVTLFIYPSAISNAKWAMTWDQVGDLKKTGLFDVESHTYWHPNFNQERQRLSPSEYKNFVVMQLTRSRQILEQRLPIRVDMLAWPFGIHDEWLEDEAQAAGYVAAVTIDRRPSSAAERLMALPRFIVRDADRGAAFDHLLGACARK